MCPGKTFSASLMSAYGKSKFVPVTRDHMKKVSPKGLKNIFNVIGRKIFNKVHKNEVEYGQTLSKKRRKNCILKSVSSLSQSEDGGGFFLNSPYRINFQFSKEDPLFRGSVVNFQKIDMSESCCEKCFCTMQKGDSFSRFSISSDSACDVSSESSCDDEECKYRKSVSKPIKRLKIKSKLSEEATKDIERTLQNFMRIHNENFKNEVANPGTVVDKNVQNCILQWAEEEPRYESLVAKMGEINKDEPGYDILVTRSNCTVVEPSYENLKLIKTFYETPEGEKSTPQESHQLTENKEVPKSNKTYDEVIESLKLWHLNLKYPNDIQNCSCCGERIENEFNHYVEGYESLENDFNNDIEEFSC